MIVLQEVIVQRDPVNLSHVQQVHIKAALAKALALTATADNIAVSAPQLAPIVQ